MTVVDREPEVDRNDQQHDRFRRLASDRNGDALFEGPPSACWLNPAARLAELEMLRAQINEGPTPDATERQHARGKLTAYERIEHLLDAASFVELDSFARHRASAFGIDDDRPFTDGVVTGWGTIHGRTVVVYAHDFRIFGGALGEVFAAKIQAAQDLALKIGAPIIGINDGVGARIQEGVSALNGYGGVFRRNTQASGIIPQISVMLGPCAGGAAYSPALTDFVFAVRDLSNMFITGPSVVESVTGERVTKDGLGGYEVLERSGVATFTADDEQSCLEDVRYLLSFLPSNNLEHPPTYDSVDDPERRCEELRSALPDRVNVAYDIHAVIESVVDDGELLEYCARWAGNVVCGLARLGGNAVGIVANQPLVMAGVLDIDAAEKAARFVRTCDAFNIPLITFVDTPGFLPGVSQEHRGIIRHGAKLLYAYCDASVPRIQVILRKAYGGAYIVMDSSSIGADLSLAWPTNEVAVMGAEPAVDLLFGKQIGQSSDPTAARHQLTTEYLDELGGPYAAAERRIVNDVIDPADTRRLLVRSLRMLRTKGAHAAPRHHGNIPL